MRTYNSSDAMLKPLDIYVKTGFTSDVGTIIIIIVIPIFQTGHWGLERLRILFKVPVPVSEGIRNQSKWSVSDSKARVLWPWVLSPFYFCFWAFSCLYIFMPSNLYKVFPLWILVLLPCLECSFLSQDPIVTSIVSWLHIILFESYSIALVCV